MQESKPFVALAKSENGWVFEKSEVPLPYSLYQTGVRVWLAHCYPLGVYFIYLEFFSNFCLSLFLFHWTVFIENKQQVETQ